MVDNRVLLEGVGSNPTASILYYGNVRINNTIEQTYRWSNDNYITLFNMERSKKNIKCEAYCKDGRKCNHGVSINGLCMIHFLIKQKDPKKWEKSQKRLKAQAN